MKGSVILTNIETLSCIRETPCSSLFTCVCPSHSALYLGISSRWRLDTERHGCPCVMGLTSNSFRIVHKLKSVHSFVPVSFGYIMFCWLFISVYLCYVFPENLPSAAITLDGHLGYFQFSVPCIKHLWACFPWVTDYMIVSAWHAEGLLICGRRIRAFHLPTDILQLHSQSMAVLRITCFLNSCHTKEYIASCNLFTLASLLMI